MRISVVWSTDSGPQCASVSVVDGATVGEVLQAAKLSHHLAAGGAGAAVGIWGRLVDPDHRVHAGDRVEIYQALRADPRDERRRRVAAGETMGARNPVPKN